MKLNAPNKIPLVSISTTRIQMKQIVYNPAINQGCFCKLPYPGYPEGCPNYNHNPHCPPHAIYFGNYANQYTHFTLIYAFFHFMAYKIRMKLKHPDWGDKQLGNSRLWQSQIKRMLKEKVQTLMTSSDDLVFGCGSGMWDQPSMEAAGIDVVKTCNYAGIPVFFAKEKQDSYILVCLLCQKQEIQGLDY